MAYDYIRLNPTQGPLYQQLYEELKKGIESGRLKKGSRLPSIRKFSEDLKISRTTVESAYQQLAAEGYIESRPQSGFYVLAESHISKSSAESTSVLRSSFYPVQFNLGTDLIDGNETDIRIWKSLLRDVLNRKHLLSSYGDPQGEPELRQALSSYTYRLRGVAASPEQIVIGAGTQPLLSLFCGLTEKRSVALENQTFLQAQQIFQDYRMNLKFIENNSQEEWISSLYTASPDMIYINSSSFGKEQKALPMNQRYQLMEWAKRTGGWILEDDYNGELRYSARPIPALQGMDADGSVIYIGSFSKLLLPSVRIAYMVLPPHLLERYKSRSQRYNQTASKIEQLTLASYIAGGQMEKHLRKLRKSYSVKSQIMKKALQTAFPSLSFTLHETSLYYSCRVPEALIAPMQKKAAENGIRFRTHSGGNEGTLFLGFAGIPAEKIEEAIFLLKKLWKEYEPFLKDLPENF